MGSTGARRSARFQKYRLSSLSSANDNMNIVMAMNMGGDEFVEETI